MYLVVILYCALYNWVIDRIGHEDIFKMDWISVRNIYIKYTGCLENNDILYKGRID